VRSILYPAVFICGVRGQIPSRLSAVGRFGKVRCVAAPF
jgi:hypothetical protein